ncbi:MAG: hypothetical protein KJ970_12620 [Candidatus Eisenbacteria bacterium]|uniref:Uncharacterized protein n=1 Tax=Eiseniibacteriota bacterium TaxID=2212470 RepID=A0A948W430_UNCEI|nr:hypothetical protein [Candidatus Eisenbacteria bacterium]
MNRTNPKATKKAKQAADLLAKAAGLMREAAEMSDNTIAGGRYDFLHWATEIEELLSCDDGEAGINPALDKKTRTNQ